MTLARRALAASVFAGAALVGLAQPALATTYAGASLSNLTFSAPGGSTAGVVGSGAATQVVLTSLNTNTSPDFLTALINVGSVFVPTTPGSLNTLLASGAAGDIYFDQAAETGYGGYWQVQIADPNNAANSLVFYEYGSSSTGPNGESYFNSASQGTNYVGAILKTLAGVNGGAPAYDGPVCGAFPSFAACTAGGVSLYNGLFTGFGSNDTHNNTWDALAALTVDGTTLGSWTVQSLGVVTGAYVNDTPSSLTISQITAPGPAPVPEPAAWVMMLVGVGAIGGMARRRRSSAIVVA